MSVQAMSWAIEQQHENDPGARHVLLVLGNFADSKGRNAFPAVATLARDTGLSERTVRAKLDHLRKVGLIVPGNQAIARVEIARADRRPTVYDLNLSRGAARAPRQPERGANDGCSGVQIARKRGATVAPEPRATASKSHATGEQNTTALSRICEDAPTRFDPLTAELVQDLEREALRRFADHRAEIGKPITAAGWEELRARLLGLWEKGVDLNEALRTAMAAGYTLPPDPRRGKAAVIERRREQQERDTTAMIAWHDRHVPPSRSDWEGAWTPH